MVAQNSSLGFRRKLFTSENKHQAENGSSDSFNSEERRVADNVRRDSDIFRRGLLDGYRQEMERDRIQRMRREREDEMRSRVKEGEGEMRSIIQKEIRKEMEN